MELTELHKVTYLLTHWQYYERQKDYLTNTELRDAMFFFNALQRISSDDFELLRSKYYDAETFKIGTAKPNSDEVCRHKYKLSLEAYRRKRHKVSIRLANELDNVIADFSQDLNNNLEEFILGYKGWYVVGQANNLAGDILLTRDKSRASFFKRDELFEGADEFNKLIIN